jgi:hypothetical protein
MQITEIKKLVDSKKFLVSSFIFTASLRSEGDKDAALKHGVTGHFLQAVILELIIKILFELDTHNAAPFTHNLGKLYPKLGTETKKMLTESYDKARGRRRKQFPDANIKDVHFHPFGDVLDNNEKTVKNFKYDAIGVKSNSSVDGVFYSEVLKYIDNRLDKIDV